MVQNTYLRLAIRCDERTPRIFGSSTETGWVRFWNVLGDQMTVSWRSMPPRIRDAHRLSSTVTLSYQVLGSGKTSRPCRYARKLVILCLPCQVARGETIHAGAIPNFPEVSSLGRRRPFVSSVHSPQVHSHHTAAICQGDTTCPGSIPMGITVLMAWRKPWAPTVYCRSFVTDTPPTLIHSTYSARSTCMHPIPGFENPLISPDLRGVNVEPVGTPYLTLPNPHCHTMQYSSEGM